MSNLTISDTVNVINKLKELRRVDLVFNLYKDGSGRLTKQFGRGEIFADWCDLEGMEDTIKGLLGSHEQSKSGIIKSYLKANS